MIAFAVAGNVSALLREFLITTVKRIPVGVGVNPCNSSLTEALELSVLLWSAAPVAVVALVEVVGSAARF